MSVDIEDNLKKIERKEEKTSTEVKEALKDIRHLYRTIRGLERKLYKSIQLINFLQSMVLGSTGVPASETSMIRKSITDLGTLYSDRQRIMKDIIMSPESRNMLYELPDERFKAVADKVFEPEIAKMRINIFDKIDDIEAKVSKTATNITTTVTKTTSNVALFRTVLSFLPLIIQLVLMAVQAWERMEEITRLKENEKFKQEVRRELNAQAASKIRERYRGSVPG